MTATVLSASGACAVPTPIDARLEQLKVETDAHRAWGTMKTSVRNLAPGTRPSGHLCGKAPEPREVRLQRSQHS
jgi:hypothetical protein